MAAALHGQAIFVGGLHEVTVGTFRLALMGAPRRVIEAVPVGGCIPLDRAGTQRDCFW
jgi:hypothetical protein